MASKTKVPKGGWQAHHWPKPPAGTSYVVVDGYCAGHSSSWCPCAAPSLYEKKSYKQTPVMSGPNFKFKGIPAWALEKARFHAAEIQRNKTSVKMWNSNSSLPGLIGEWVYGKIIGREPDWAFFVGGGPRCDYDDVNVKCVPYPKNPLLMVTPENLAKDLEGGCNFYALIAWDKDASTAAYIGHASMEEVQAAQLQDYGYGENAICHMIPWQAVHPTMPPTHAEFSL